MEALAPFTRVGMDLVVPKISDALISEGRISGEREGGAEHQCPSAQRTFAEEQKAKPDRKAGIDEDHSDECGA